MTKLQIAFSILLLTILSLVGCDSEDDMPIINPEPEIPLIDTLTTTNGIQFVRTPEKHFEDLVDWPFAYQYVEIEGLRQAYAESGPADGPVVLLLHGQPSWSYLYRKMIPPLADAGFRVIAMDHLGMGRSDKPLDIDEITYLRNSDRLEQFIQILGLQEINLFVQDWGSLIGLRVAGLNPDWFASITVGNGRLLVIPEGVEPFPDVVNPNEVDPSLISKFDAIPAQQYSFYAEDGCTLLMENDSDFGEWMEYAMKAPTFTPSEVNEALTWYDLSPEEEKAYDAPYPSREYLAGPRKFPSMINEIPGQNDEAWAGLRSYVKPFLTIWGGNDAGGAGSCEAQQEFTDNVPGAVDKPHVRLPEASHFLQSDQGPEIARRLIEFYNTDWPDATIDDGEVQMCEEDDPALHPSRYCEILFAKVVNGELIAEIWGTQALVNCPADCWDAIDLEDLAFENQALAAIPNGPRIWLPAESSIDFVDENITIFGGLPMRQLGNLVLDQSQIMAGTGNEPYVESEVRRNNSISYPAGSEVYELMSPDGKVYTMQSLSQIVNPDLKPEDLTNLASVLDLPEGWSYEARMLTEELVQTADGETIVLTDDLQNTYQIRP